MIAGAHDERRIAKDRMDDEPTVTSLLLELQDAGIEQGKALGRGDDQSAAGHYRRSLQVIDRIRRMVGEDDVMPRPILNAVPE